MLCARACTQYCNFLKSFKVDLHVLIRSDDAVPKPHMMQWITELYRTVLEPSSYMYALASFFRSTGTGSPHILDQ